jgi:prefoldin subunit 5
MEKKQVKFSHEAVSKLIREHAEMTRLLESFPEEISQINAWIKKKNQFLEKLKKHK